MQFVSLKLAQNFRTGVKEYKVQNSPSQVVASSSGSNCQFDVTSHYQQSFHLGFRGIHVAQAETPHPPTYFYLLSAESKLPRPPYSHFNLVRQK